MSYRTADVEVRGGDLRVGVWESKALAPGSVAERTVLGVHGITSSHLAWALVAQQLIDTPRTRVISPDLRGRGRSAGLPGPWGMDTHTDDLAAVIDQLGEPDLTAGHSMGGFVAVVAQHRYPARFGKLLLLDGGVPLPLPRSEPAEVVMLRLLGPTATRLALRFPDHEAHRQWWRNHPAFAGAWSAALLAYLDYDLVEDADQDSQATAGNWHSAARSDAVAQDFAEQGPDGSVQAAWDARISTQSAKQVTFLRAPLGLQAEPPGLYPTEALQRFAFTHPGFGWTEVPDTNHYTLVLGHRGAEYVAAVAAELLPRSHRWTRRPGS